MKAVKRRTFGIPRTGDIGSVKLAAAASRYVRLRGISHETAMKSGVRSLDDDEVRELTHKAKRGEAILIPYPGTKHFRLRLLSAHKNEFKFWQARDTACFLYEPVLLKNKDEIRLDTSIRLVICEKEFGALAAAQRGIPCVAIGGVWCWQQGGTVIEQLNAYKWKGRRVELAFDADLLTKMPVKRALIALMDWLLSKGAFVYIKKLPLAADGGNIGLDDFLASHSAREFETLETLDSNGESVSLWRQQLQRESSDVGNGEFFAEHFGEVMRYVDDLDQWITWNDRGWQLDSHSGLGIVGIAKDATRLLRQRADDEKDEKIRATLRSHARISQGRERVRAMIYFARNEPDIPISASTLDSDPYLLGVQNGVLNLKTGELLEPLPRDVYVTKRSNAEFDPRAKAPRFEQFLEEIMLGDSEMISFVQRWLGYCLTGATNEQAFCIWYGTGDNGKSVLTNVALELLGEYAMSIDLRVIAVDSREGGDRPNDTLASMRGARLVTAPETSEYGRLDDALLKRLTGQDVIRTRTLNKPTFEYRPQFKLVIFGNHRPHLRGDDPALWRRTLLVPFEYSVPAELKDRALDMKLRDELAGILNWALQGCMEWQKNGLAPPPKVIAATSDYREAMDNFGEFVSRYVHKAEGRRVRSSDLYTAYRRWSERTGGTQARSLMSQTAFSMRLEERGFKKKKYKQGISFLDIELRDEGSA